MAGPFSFLESELPGCVLRRVGLNQPRLPARGSDLGKLAWQARRGYRTRRSTAEGVLECGDLAWFHSNGALGEPTDSLPERLLPHLDVVSFAGILHQDDEDAFIFS